MSDIEEEIAALEERIKELKATRPAHSAGLHDMEITRLEDELYEKRKALETGGRGTNGASGA